MQNSSFSYKKLLKYIVCKSMQCIDSNRADELYIKISLQRIKAIFILNKNGKKEQKDTLKCITVTWRYVAS
jgi:hypothetical protein